MLQYEIIISICRTLGTAVLSSSADGVKKAYRSFAVKCHPDKFKTREEKQEAQDVFINVTDAYETATGAAPTAAEYIPTPGYGPASSGSERHERATPADELLFNAATEGNIKAAREAVDEGADVNYADGNGFTLLSEAVKHARTEMVRMLIKYGADVRHEDKWGNTPMTFAMYIGNMDILRLLTEHMP